MIVFDVDYTLWPYWVDTHTRAPYMHAKDGSGKIWDSSRREIELFPQTAKVRSVASAPAPASGARCQSQHSDP